jgi:hypothetical protein
LIGLALSLTLLRLSDVQRLVGLTAVTVVGAAWVVFSLWVLAEGVTADAASSIPLLSTLLVVAVCYVAQVGGRQSKSRHGAAANA